MLTRILNRVLSLFSRKSRSDCRSFLAECKGVVHVGANSGQERHLYQAAGLNVLWIEPIPDVFFELTKNIAHMPRQKAVQSLITDQSGQSYEFNVANNGGLSSSILSLKKHKDIWPDVSYVSRIPLVSKTLPEILELDGVDPNQYDALVMDTQGSELLVLRGAASLLSNFKYIMTEAPNFEAYEGCCLLSDLRAFLATKGFKQVRKQKFATRNWWEGYYDVVFKRETNNI